MQDRSPAAPTTQPVWEGERPRRLPRSEGAYATNALGRAHATYPDVLDSDAKYTATFAGLIPLNAVPSSVLVRNGQAVAVHVGPFQGWKDLVRGVNEQSGR